MVADADKSDVLTVKLSKVAAVNHAPDGALRPVQWSRKGLFALSPTWQRAWNGTSVQTSAFWTTLLKATTASSATPRYRR